MTTSKLNALIKRWRKATGGPMPEEIGLLPLERIRIAVELVEAGDTVFVPKAGAVAVEATTGGSMVDWDSRGEF